ncbi:MAG TPA: SRPBCC domain-containing protein [Acidiferrobacterales bacterium]|nr:SRPBCC domain-containing protein [Acidiferrobacterales bacterium]
MKSFASSIVIQAAPEAIWRVLTDAPAYPQWNTTVTRIDGAMALGQKLTVHAKATPGRAFPVKVVAMDAPTRMIWCSGMPLGLFKGERMFELRPKSGSSVEFTMREDYSGWLAPLITKSIPDLQPAFDEFAACLKARVEGS